jgi:hypothetical protein
MLNPVDQHARLLGEWQLDWRSSMGARRSRWTGVVGGAAVTFGARMPTMSATAPRKDFMFEDGVQATRK